MYEKLQPPLTESGAFEQKDSARGGGAGNEHEGLSPRANWLMHMHHTAGNAAVQRMSRSPIQLKSKAPNWMEEDLGISRQDSANFEQFEKANQDPANFSRQGSKPLPDSVKSEAEQHHGYNLDGVNLVQGGQADTYCNDMNAKAFCTPDRSGSDIFVHSGIDLGSAEGQHTLHHEIAHAVQNSKGETGEINGLGGNAGVRNQLERSADQQADAILTKRNSP